MLYKLCYQELWISRHQYAFINLFCDQYTRGTSICLLIRSDSISHCLKALYRLLKKNPFLLYEKGLKKIKTQFSLGFWSIEPNWIWRQLGTSVGSGKPSQKYKSSQGRNKQYSNELENFSHATGPHFYIFGISRKWGKHPFNVLCSLWM